MIDEKKNSLIFPIKLLTQDIYFIPFVKWIILLSPDQLVVDVTVLNINQTLENKHIVCLTL